jgi:DNA repair exonuclease SbcCD ATPase subunit
VTLPEDTKYRITQLNSFYEIWILFRFAMGLVRRTGRRDITERHPGYRAVPGTSRAKSTQGAIRASTRGTAENRKEQLQRYSQAIGTRAANRKAQQSIRRLDSSTRNVRRKPGRIARTIKNIPRDAVRLAEGVVISTTALGASYLAAKEAAKSAARELAALTGINEEVIFETFSADLAPVQRVAGNIGSFARRFQEQAEAVEEDMRATAMNVRNTAVEWWDDAFAPLEDYVAEEVEDIELFYDPIYLDGTLYGTAAAGTGAVAEEAVAVSGLTLAEEAALGLLLL